MAISQTLGRQSIGTQGGVFISPTGLVFSQSVGQLSVIGNTTMTTYTFQQGFQQSFVSLFENKVDLLNFSVTIYPNPFIDSFTVALSNPLEELATISIVTLLGQQVYQTQLAPFQTQKTISFGFYPSGTYLVQLRSKNQTISKKIIKN